MNLGSRRDHNQFCVTEQWTLVRNARGGKVRHHLTYELDLPDGRILRTRISRPVNGNTYGADLWKRILREQLEVTEQKFWDCVTNGVRPGRGATPTAPSAALPAQLVYQLIHMAGAPESDVAAMTLDEAVARMHEHWAKPQ